MRNITYSDLQPFVSIFCPAAKSAKVVSENMEKLQRDREFLQALICDTLNEVVAGGDFPTLIHTLQECHQEKVKMEETILR